MIENKQLVVVEEKIKGMQTMIEGTKVTNDIELSEISDKIKNVKKLGAYVKAEKEKFTAPAKEIIAQAKEMYDPALKQCENAEGVLKSKAQVYLTEKETKRLESEKKIVERVERGTMKADTAVRKLETLPEQQTKVKTESSGLRMITRKVAEISDPNLIPDSYWVIDETRVKKEALEREKLGVEQIPGITIVEKQTMASV